MDADHSVAAGQHPLDAFLEAVPEGILVLDPESRIVRANRWMESTFGSEAPLEGRRCFEVLCGRKDPCPECPGVTAPQVAPSHTRFAYRPSGQGPSGWIEISVYPLRDASGALTGAVCHVRDVTEPKRIEERLQDEIARWRLLVEQSRDGIVVLDRDGGVYESNKRFAQMLGYRMDEMRSLHVWDWDAQWNKAHLEEMIRTVDERGDHFLTSHRRKDGTFYQAEISTNGALYQGQKLVFCICRDVTDQKRAEKAREDLIAELKEALAEVRALRGILPLCSYCKRIRDDEGYWHQVEVYIRKHSQAEISHSICPECLEKHFPGAKPR